MSGFDTNVIQEVIGKFYPRYGSYTVLSISEKLDVLQMDTEQIDSEIGLLGDVPSDTIARHVQSLTQTFSALPGHAAYLLQGPEGDRVMVMLPDAVFNDPGTNGRPEFKVKFSDAEDATVKETYTLLPSGRVVICELTMENGFTVTGKAAVIYAGNMDFAIGCKIARQRAVDEMYQILGYLKTDLIGQASLKLHR